MNLTTIFVAMHVQEKYMQRCIALAKLGAGHVAPNPMVGAVLVHDDTIIGEGYHKQYGQAHAEVNCMASVKQENKNLIAESKMYVSLEPCAHFGKTPPCADLIIKERIKKLVIGCRDPFEEVNGRGIEKLQAAGIEVVTGILEKECIDLNKRFLTFHTKHRPYIILKWAQSKNGCIANADFSRVMISNTYSNRLVHRWRSEEAAIMVGTNTAMHDDPLLTTRLWPGKNPVRIVMDSNLKIDATKNLFNEAAATLVFNQQKQSEDINILLKQNKTAYYKLNDTKNLLEVCNALYQLNINSVLVEGGAKLLQSFIDADLWDEARVIVNNDLMIDNGISAPVLYQPELVSFLQLANDTIYFYQPKPLY